MMSALLKTGAFSVVAGVGVWLGAWGIESVGVARGWWGLTVPEAAPEDTGSIERPRVVTVERWRGELVELPDTAVSPAPKRMTAPRAMSREQLDAFARSLDMGPWELRLYNDLTEQDGVEAGAPLYLEPVNDNAYWVVKPGQTLGRIAAMLNNDPEWIARDNGIDDPDLIQAGTVLAVELIEGC